nr:endothelial protein C receptor isoform X1 [Pogona vitticeps]
MLLLHIFLLPWALSCWVHGAESHAFTITQLAYFLNRTSVEFVGNATLDGTLTHSLETHNGQVNVSQLWPLENSDAWKQRERKLQDYLNKFVLLVNLFVNERAASYPLQVHCMKGCQLTENGTNSFYEVLLNGTKFLTFYATRNYWTPLQDTSAAKYTSAKLNEYNETTTDLQFFLQKTCINFIREHTDMQGPLTGKQKGRSHTPLVLGVCIGALALMGLAVCIFLCTGGKR